MRRRFAILLFLFTALAGAALAQGRVPERAQLDSISVHLFLTKSGALSEDVATIEGFGARNFAVQGKGLDLAERFYSILIKVRLTSAGEVFAKGPQAEVVVTDRRTRKVVKREKIADVYGEIAEQLKMHATVALAARLEAARIYDKLHRFFYTAQQYEAFLKQNEEIKLAGEKQPLIPIVRVGGPSSLHPSTVT